MNWKQFLKPDWRKIVIFIMLSFLPLSVPVGCPDNCIFDPVKNTTACAVCPPKILPVGFMLVGMIEASYVPVAVTSLLAFLLLYIFSCLIVWIYDKFRKKKGYMPIQNINMVMGQQKRNIKK